MQAPDGEGLVIWRRLLGLKKAVPAEPASAMVDDYDDRPHVRRFGQWIPADEAFLAWTSGDLPRMLAATGCRTNPVDRHHLLLGIVRATYKKRSGDPRMLELCLKWGRQHVEELPQLVGPLKKNLDGTLPNIPTPDLLIRVLIDASEFDEARSVCRRASDMGVGCYEPGYLERKIAAAQRRKA